MRTTSAVIFAFGMIANVCVGQQESIGILESYRARLAEIHDIKVLVHTVIYSNGVLVDEYDYDWLWSPLGQCVQVRQARSTFQGEFTGIKHRTGNSAYYNGQSGFVGLKDFDGILVDGKVPADSPASAEIGPSRNYKAGMGQVDPWGEMGLYLIHPEPPSLPPWTLTSSGWQLKVGSDPTMPLCFEAGERTYEIKFDHEQNAIKGYRLTRPQGTIELEVIDFEDIEPFGAFPRLIRTVLKHGDYTTLIETTVEVSSINVPLSLDQLRINLPEGVPFFNSETGKYGVWGMGAPAFYFDSEAEAREWSRQRSISAQVRDTGSHGPLLVAALILITLLAAGLVYVRKKAR